MHFEVKKIQKNISCLVVIWGCLSFFNLGCGKAPLPPPPKLEPLDMSQGFYMLATHLSQQIRRGRFKGTLPTLALEPLVEYETGYMLKVNTLLSAIMAQAFQEKFRFLGLLEPERIEQTDYIMTAVASIQKNTEANIGISDIYATVYKRLEGDIIAGSHVIVRALDTTPLEIYEKSPIFLRGNDGKLQHEVARLIPGKKVPTTYQKEMKTRSFLSKGVSLHKNSPEKAKTYFDEALSESDRPRLDVLSMNFVAYFEMGFHKQAEVLFSKIVKQSIKETQKLESKIMFGVNSFRPVNYETTDILYGIYLRQVASYLTSHPSDCSLKIVGHSSRSGKDEYNIKLSGARARWIKRALVKEESSLNNRIDTKGKGFHENIIGTGADDITDQVDRRVEFLFERCH